MVIGSYSKHDATVRTFLLFKTAMLAQYMWAVLCKPCVASQKHYHITRRLIMNTFASCSTSGPIVLSIDLELTELVIVHLHTLLEDPSGKMKRSHCPQTLFMKGRYWNRTSEVHWWAVDFSGHVGLLPF